MISASSATTLDPPMSTPVQAHDLGHPHVLAIAKRQRLHDALFYRVSQAFAVLVLMALIGIIVTLFINAWPAFREFGFAFIWTAEWDVVNEQFGALMAIIGTLATSAIAMIIGVPLAFGIALFLTETCPVWLRRPLGTAVELLAAIPSIIYGMFGLFVFAPLFADYFQIPLQELMAGMPIVGAIFGGVPNGLGILAAGIILSFMVLPYMAAVTRDVFEVVPQILRESAYGLGATTTEVVRHVVMPYAFKGVVGAVMLGLGRALGETMAVTFVIGNAHRIPETINAPGVSITSALANEFAESFGMHMHTLFALGFLLFILTFVVLALARLLILHVEEGKGSKGY